MPVPLAASAHLRQDMEALVGEVGRSHADVALELEGRKQREVRGMMDIAQCVTAKDLPA